MQPVLRASDPQADLCLLGTVYFAQECAPESEAIRIAFHGGVESKAQGWISSWVRGCLGAVPIRMGRALDPC